MDIQQAFLAYEAFIDNTEIQIEHNIEGICPTCHTAMLIEDNRMWLCKACGCIEEIGAVVEAFGYKPKKSLYHRRSYFVERLNLICGFKQSQSPLYKPMIKRLRKCKFKTITRLRSIMKKLGYNKFYKYIYNIYYDIKKVRHVKLKQQRITQLADEFIILEGFFKQNRDKHCRKNLFSYSVLIYMLLKRNKIKGYSKILLPHDSTTLLKSIQTHCH
jgi:hypothetical protein